MLSKKDTSFVLFVYNVFLFKNGRGARIRTEDPLLPKAGALAGLRHTPTTPLKIEQDADKINACSAFDIGESPAYFFPLPKDYSLLGGLPCPV